MVLFPMHVDIQSNNSTWICANVTYKGKCTTVEITLNCSCGETHELDYDPDSYYSTPSHLPRINITPSYGRTNEAN